MEIFDYDREKYPRAHMPYVVMDDSRARQFGCVMVNGLWKAHELVDHEWVRIDTGLPEDATECSPFAWYNHVDMRLETTFVGGASVFSLPFRIYAGSPFDYHEVVRGSVGYKWKGIVVHGDGSPEFDIDGDNRRRRVRLNGVSSIYRLSMDETDPLRIFASCTLEEGGIKTYAVGLQYGTCDELLADGHATYKPCLFDGKCAYALKCGEGFEDREIAVTGNWDLVHVDGVVEIEEEQIAEED